MSSCMWALLDIVGPDDEEKKPESDSNPTGRKEDACEAIISGSGNTNQTKGTSDELSKMEV